MRPLTGRLAAGLGALRERLDLHGQRSWGAPVTLAALVVLASGVLGNLPAGRRRAVATVSVLGVLVLLWLLVLARRPRRESLRLLVVAGAGVAGAVLVVLQPAGPGYVACYLSVAGLALLLPLRVALPAALVVMLAAVVAMLVSGASASAVSSVGLGAAALFAAVGFASASRAARERAERLLALETSARVAREQAATLRERARLARELHDVLAHTLAGLTVQLQATLLLARRTGADTGVVGQLDALRQLANEGMSSAKGAVAALRGDALPGPEQLPALLADRPAGAGAAVTLRTVGVARPLAPEVGLAVYRTVQEALTNIAKHAGVRARAEVRLGYLPEAVEVDVTNSGGAQLASTMPSGRFGLSGLAERAALLDGQFSAGPTADGYLVHLHLPAPELGHGADAAGGASSHPEPAAPASPRRARR